MYETHEEKKTDVNIAVHILKSAILDEFDTAIISSADSDLLPVVEAIRELFPMKKVGVLIPITLRAHHLKDICNFSMRIKEKHLRPSIFQE